MKKPTKKPTKPAPKMKRASAKSPLTVGTAVLIRTVTHYLTGRVEAVGEHEILLSSAAWIADTGRYADALRTGTLSEVEPYPDGIVAVGRGAIVDAAIWPHALPREQR